MLFWLCSHMSLWKGISFNFAVVINIIVAAFYPFSATPGGQYLVTIFLSSTRLTRSSGHFFNSNPCRSGSSLVWPCLDGHVCFVSHCDCSAQTAWRQDVYCFSHITAHTFCGPGTHAHAFRHFECEIIQLSFPFESPEATTSAVRFSSRCSMELSSPSASWETTGHSPKPYVTS